MNPYSTVQSDNMNFYSQTGFHGIRWKYTCKGSKGRMIETRHLFILYNVGPTVYTILQLLELI